MIYKRVGNIITITLNDDEIITMDYVDSISKNFMNTFLSNFLNGRKLQQMDTLKDELVGSLDRTQLVDAKNGKLSIPVTTIKPGNK